MSAAAASDHDHDHDDAHDRGLAFDLGVMSRLRPALVAASGPTLLGRRGALKVLGGLGLLALAGCGSDGSTAGQASSGSTGSTGSSGSTGSTGGTAAASTTAAAGSETSGGSCTAIPQETAGPYPGDGSNGPNVLNQSGVVRRDITSSFGSSTTKAKGVPLTVVLAVQKLSAGCAAYKGAAVYLWHCDQQGRYSLYDQGVTQENYLRGVQEADADGNVTFTTVYPGAYSGRYPHIHFQVFDSLAKAASGAELRTSQIALPEAASKLAYAATGYERSVTNNARTSLAGDNVFRDGATLQTPSFSGDATSGFTIKLPVPV